MSKTINNLNKSLAQNITPSAIGAATISDLNTVKNNIGNVSNLKISDKTIVGAINELFQSVNNGKELIANAIGEPVSAEDTFSAMSNDINNLLSTFKTNMMNNGITVESGDKFKNLIDKITTMVEEGSSKGIQFASGTVDNFDGYYQMNVLATKTITHNCGFVPTYLFLYFKNINSSVGTEGKFQHVCITNNTSQSDYALYRINGVVYLYMYLDNITSTTFNFNYFTTQIGVNNAFSDISWYAIGVGEEDTTLRDSLASILQEEGVSVTEEDDMASLISKVDEEFDRQVVPQGNALPEDVVSGKTFINSTGQTITGTMVNRGGAQTVTPGTSNKTLNAGYYSGNITIAGDADLVAANIVSGKNIFGVTGTLKKYKFPDWYTVQDSNVWISGGAIPALIGRYGTATVNGIIHCINNAQHLCYDIKTNSYITTRAIIPTARSGFIMESVGNKIYCIGGSTTIANNDCYDETTDTWTAKTVTPKPLSGASGAAIGNIIYQMGGIISNYNYNKTVHAYDTTSDSWTTKASLPRNCSSSGSDSIGNFIYVFGGQYSSGSDTSNTIYCYDSTTNTWTTKAATIYSSRMTYTAAVNGKLYCMGGMNSNGSAYLNFNYCYDPSNETVTVMQVVPTTLCSLGGYRLPKVDKYICVIGGSKATAVNSTYGRLSNDIFIP